MPGDAALARRARNDAIRLLVDAGDLPGAIAQTRALVAEDPSDGDAIANLGALLVAGGDEEGGRSEFRRALGGPVRFSSEQVFVATTLRYLRLAISAQLEPVELAMARDLAARVDAANPGDPSLRFIVLALEVRSGLMDGRAEIERIEREARAVGTTAFADEVAKFLASLPARR